MNDLKEINLNGKARVKLNEKGLLRVNELIQRVRDTKDTSDYSKSIVIREMGKKVDDEGYLTDNLNSIMGEFDTSCFETSEFTMQDIDTHEWFDLDMSVEVTVKLNGKGVVRTLRKVSEIERADTLSSEDKKRMVDEIESNIDEENNFTTSLGFLVSNYNESCFENQLAMVSDEPAVTRGAK